MLYRVRKRLHTTRFWLAARGIYRTPPLPCDPTADCSIHTMLSHSDLLMYLLAIKSFLRFRPLARVVVHSDGSLTRGDEAVLHAHVPNIRIVSSPEADTRAQQELNPFLLDWRRRDASWRRVIDTELWCETPRRMIIDADILTIRQPSAVLEWMAGAGGGRPLLFGAPAGPPSGPIAAGVGRRHMQTIFREQLATVAALANRPAEFFQGATSGYYGCERELSLSAIETVLRAGLEAGVPMHEWGGEQCLVVYLLSTAQPIRLDPRQYVNFAPEVKERLPEVAVAHFFGTFRYHGGIYPRLAAAVVRDLLRRDPKGTATPP
jgi:hypothetical protein